MKRAIRSESLQHLEAGRATYIFLRRRPELKKKTGSFSLLATALIAKYSLRRLKNSAYKKK
jgi:hypothetical protein